MKQEPNSLFVKGELGRELYNRAEYERAATELKEAVAAAAGRTQDALRYLQEAVKLGYRDGDGMQADEDLRDLRHNPHFLDLVATLKNNPPKEGT